MKPAWAVRLVRGTATFLAQAYPAPFRAAHQDAFADVAEDRWRRECTRGRGRWRAAVATIALLFGDTWTGVRLVRRLNDRPSSRRPLMFDRLFDDFRLGLRALVRAPLVTFVATLSLAVGIGANTAVMSVANTLLFAPPPGVGNPDRVVDVCRSMRGTGCDTAGYQTYLDYRAQMTSLSDVYAMRFEPTPISLGSGQGADLLFAREVSANYFHVLEVKPVVGRFFAATDQRAAPQLREAVLSAHLWRDKFGADPAIAGRAIELNGDSFQVVGVADAAFDDASVLRPDVWVPLTAGSRGLPTAHLLKSRESLWLLMGARMKPGATLERVRSESAGVMASLQRTYPDVYHDHGFAVQPLRRLQAGFAGVAPFFAFLLALVGIVLIAACANLAGVLLARGSNRAKEFALRRALGASRGSLLTLCGIECLILFLPGFALAFIVARVTLTSVGRLTNGLPVPVNAQVSIDWSTVAVTTAVTVGLAVVTALLPAWQTTGGSLVGDLKQDAAAPRRQRLRRLVVATQVAFCLATIAIGGVLFRAAHLAAAADPGFSVANVDIATVNFELGAYQSKQANGATEALRERIAAIPGVARVGAASLIPLEGSRMGFGDLRRPGTTGADASIDAGQSVISPDYLPALGISITRGRNFTQADRAETTLHVIVNERFAKVVWPNQDPIGQRLEFGDFRPDHADTISTVTVVGIARDVTYKTVGEGPTSFVYFPLGELEYMKPHYFIVRQPGFSSEALAPALRQTLARFDRTLPLVDFVPFARYAEITSMPQRIAASIAGSLGALALALAAMGLYGLTAFTVASRTREIGVRVALGASRVGILRMVIWQAARTATIGAGAGLVLALVTARLLSTVLYGVPPVDALAVGVATMVVGGVGLVATYLPARRAATVDPMTALRVD